MQVGSAFNAGQAMEQVSRSIQAVNDLNKEIVDKNQDLSGKMLKVAVEEKVQPSENQIDFMA